MVADLISTVFNNHSIADSEEDVEVSKLAFLAIFERLGDPCMFRSAYALTKRVLRVALFRFSKLLSLDPALLKDHLVLGQRASLV